MIRNYIFSILRKIKRNIGVNLINILGLSIGLAVSFLIYIYLIHETGFDKQHVKGDRIFRLISNYHPEGSESNYTISYIEDSYLLKLNEEFPEVEEIISIYKINGNYRTKYSLKSNNNETIRFTSPEIVNIFTFELLKGDKENLLKNDFDVLITKSKSDQYFGNDNPIGKIITLETEMDTVLLTVKGVIKDFPVNSTIKFDILGKLSNSYNNYYKNFFPEETYLLLQQNANYKDFEGKLPKVTYDYGTKMINSFTLQPLADIYFNSDFLRSYPKKTGNKRNIYILGIIAVIILFVSINNYIIFSIFDTKHLTKEIAIRKTLGASLKNLQMQQLINSFIYTLIAVIIAILFILIIIPYWNQYFEVNLYPILYTRVNSLIGLFSIIFLSASISGIYCSIYISFLNPTHIFYPSYFSIKKKNFLQKIIIVFQIILFISLTTFSLTVKKQVEFALNKETGFDKNDLLIIDFSAKEIGEKYNVFKNEINTLPFVKKVSAISHNIPNDDFYKVHFPKFDDPSINVISYLIMVDNNFFKTMSIPFLESENDTAFSHKGSYIINELATQELGFNSDTKFPIKYYSNDGNSIIIEKVCKNFDFQSINHKLAPLAIRLRNSKLNYIIVKLRKNKPDDAVFQIETIYKKMVSNEFNFQANFLDRHIEKCYRDDKLFLNAIFLGTLLTLFIATLGLLNVSLLIIKTKTKEILIRKVYGANSWEIIKLFSYRELLLVLGANIAAIPITLIIINKWFQNYAYHVKVSIGIFTISFVLSIIIMVLIVTLSLKSIFRKNLFSELNKE